MLGRGGILIVPAFAVGRAQQMIYMLRLLTLDGKIPNAPIYLDSPMALEATRVYEKYHALQPGERQEWEAIGGSLGGSQVHLVRTQQESMKLNSVGGPAVIISSSGMITGGRILHHLRHHLPDPRNFVLLVGYQAEGTRGRALQDGTQMLRIFKEEVRVRCGVGVLHGLSGHADYHELGRWLTGYPAPRMAFVTHGEEEQSVAFARRLRAENGFKVEVPHLGQDFTL